MKNIIISLTTIYSRIDIARYTIESLVRQSGVQGYNYIIILNLSKKSYLLDKGITSIPVWLNGHKEDALEVNWVENTGSYRKLLPVIDRIQDDDMVITVDDDVIYGHNWLCRLMEAVRDHSDKIICGTAKKPVYNIIHSNQSYINWVSAEPGESGLNLIPIGVGSVAYRKAFFDLPFLLDPRFKNLAPTTDDIWFKAASALKKTHVYVAPGVMDEVHKIKTSTSLFDNNRNNAQSQSNNFALAFINKITNKTKAYLGAPLGYNDTSVSNIKRFYKIDIGNL